MRSAPKGVCRYTLYITANKTEPAAQHGADVQKSGVSHSPSQQARPPLAQVQWASQSALNLVRPGHETRGAPHQFGSLPGPFHRFHHLFHRAQPRTNALPDNGARRMRSCCQVIAKDQLMRIRIQNSTVVILLIIISSSPSSTIILLG